MGKTRQEKRNKASNDVCRELRWQIVKYGEVADANRIFSFLEKWMAVAKKDKYNRPE